MKWVSLSNISTALNVSNVRSVYNRANRECWEYRERNNEREYLFISLPSVVQSKVVEVSAKAISSSTALVKTEKNKSIKQGKNLKIGLMRACLVGKMKSLCLTVEEFTSLYNLGRVNVPPDIREKYLSIDDSTMYRWLKMSPTADPVKLSPDYGRDSDGFGEKTLTAEDKKILTGLYFCTKKWTAARCYRAWEELTGKTVSYSTVSRFFSSFPPALHAWRRVGSKELNDKFMPYQNRDYTKFDVMGLWCSDHHMLDVFVKDGDKMFRPWLTVFQDMRSRKIVGWYISVNPSTYTILQALSMAVTDFGCPDGVYFDNGKDYRSDRLNGKVVTFSNGEQIQITGIFQKYNIKVHFAEPYHGQSKPVERFFRTVLEEFSKTFDSFVGSNTSITLQENKDYYKHVQKTVNMTMEELGVEWGKWVTKWNATWKHRGNAMNGNTPDSVFFGGIKNRIRIDVEEQYRQTLFAKFELRPITRNGVKYDGVDYYNILFVSLLGKKFKNQSVKYRVVRDIDDIGKVYVYDLDDNLVCEAYNNVLFGENKTEEDIGQIKRKRKAVKKALKGYLDVSSDLHGNTLEEQVVNNESEQKEITPQLTKSKFKTAAGAEYSYFG